MKLLLTANINEIKDAWISEIDHMARGRFICVNRILIIILIMIKHLSSYKILILGINEKVISFL